MALLKRCEKGHFYDMEKHRQCPYCHTVSETNNSPALTPPPPDIPIQYRTLGEISFIGEGSSSKVYRIHGERDYALKITDCTGHSEKMQAALNEIEFLLRLSPLNISVHMFDYRINGSSQSPGTGTVYILEEYLTSLHEYIQQNTLSIRETLNIAIRLCDTIIACREAGIAHLDIQPKNLFITKDGNIKLGDFSSSCPLAQSPNSLRGTLAFMAPEVYRKHEYSEQSEIYSVGSVLYYLFNAGRLPFQEGSDTDLAVFKKLAGTVLPQLMFDSLTFSFKITNIIQKACAYETSERYTAFKKLRDDLRRLSNADYIPDEVIKKGAPEAPIRLFLSWEFQCPHL